MEINKCESMFSISDKSKILFPQVGEFKMAIDCLTDGQLTRFQVMDPIIILFNAWCPEDPVFMADEEKRNEYVLEDVGK